MPVEQMRHEISLVYPYPKWQNKVRRMAPNQVIAIYKSFQRNNKFEMVYEKPAGELIPPPPPSPYHQMTIFEWLKGE